MHYLPCCQTQIPLIISSTRASDQQEKKGTSTYKCIYILFAFKWVHLSFLMNLFSWIWRRLCLVIFVLTNRVSIETLLQVTTSIGEFGWSADALIALLLFIQILYTDENSAIIQIKVLKRSN